LHRRGRQLGKIIETKKQDYDHESRRLLRSRDLNLWVNLRMVACLALLQIFSSLQILPAARAEGPEGQKPVYEKPGTPKTGDEGPVDERPGVIRELQQAVRVDDKRWMADHLHLPVRYNGKKTLFIKSKAWFLQHYDWVIRPELKASILAQDPEKYLFNYQGLEVGERTCCNVWLQDLGDLGGGKGIEYEIIAINPGP
jgi:hypothetical protein